MSLKNALFLSSAMMFGQVNANVNPDYKYTSYGLSSETNSQVIETTEDIETIVNELSYLKKRCTLTGTTEKKQGPYKLSTETFQCEEGNGEINTKLLPFSGKVSLKGTKYSCSDLETSIRISQILTDGGNSVIINGKGSILEGKKAKLLMGESCKDINDFNK